MTDSDRPKNRPPKADDATVVPGRDAPTVAEPRARGRGSARAPDNGVKAKAPGPATELVGQHQPTQALSAPGSVPTSRSAPVPEILKNRFILERVLGAGGMGVVYKAKDLLKVEAQDRDPYVAIKVLGEEFKAHPEAFIALQRESRKTQRIAHPNIVNVHDFDKDGDTVFMTMEYLEGSPLDRLIKRYRATGLPHRDVWQILSGICSALAYAHQQNIVHADLKPGNIFVTDQNLAKVFDFGIARAVARAEVEADDNDHTPIVARKTQKNDDKTVFDAGTLGAYTPAYASLEMLQGEPPDIRDDVYALGCIAYEMLTGRHPYQRKNAKQVLREGLRPARIPGLKQNQWRAIESALAVKRGARLPSVPAFQALISQPRKRSYVGWVLGPLLLAAGAGLVYQAEFDREPQQPVVSEDQVRGEIEQRIRVELVENTITALLAEPAFDERWQELLWNEMQNLQGLVGADADTVKHFNDRISTAYLEQIRAALAATEFERAEQLLANAGRYPAAGEELAKLQAELTAAVNAQNEEQVQMRSARQQQAAVEQKDKQQEQREQAYTAGLSNVNSLLSCETPVAMADLAIAVKHLRNMDAKRFANIEGELVGKLAACIKTTGRRNPEQARVMRQESLALFDSHPVLQAISIANKDPCNPRLAGLGARNKGATCQDNLAGGGRGPRLVIIPKSGSTPVFAIGRYEISVAEFNEYCGTAPGCSPRPAADGELPVTSLSVKQAQDYLQWLGAKTGFRYRIPTGAEWRHAATANGQSLPANRICLLDSRGLRIGGALVAANLGQQNPWGLVNSVGNAREWVDAGGSYVAAGGSYKTPMDECTTATEQRVKEGGDRQTGLRVVRELARAE